MANLSGYNEKVNYDQIKIYQDEVQLTKFKIIICLKIEPIILHSILSDIENMSLWND